MKLLLALTATLAFCFSSSSAMAIEEPNYTVQRRVGNIEERQYPPTLVAEVIVPGPSDAAGSQGFKILAAYIFGKNKGARNIAMTAPVSQSAPTQKIEMTAPVMQTSSGGDYAIQFTMPAELTLDSVPEPVDPAVKIRAIPAARYAVIRYTGFWSDSNFNQHLAELREAARSAGWQVEGEPIYARYDPPWIPWFMRRNEIWLNLK